MSLEQGTRVCFEGKVIGVVAGLYHPINYGTDLYTIVLDDPNIEFKFGSAWFWNDYHTSSHPLHTICKDKWCYNIRERFLKKATTKLGNEL